MLVVTAGDWVCAGEYHAAQSPCQHVDRFEPLLKVILVMPVAHPNARVKLDCEENRQSTAISLSQAPPLAMLCFAFSRRRRLAGEVRTLQRVPDV
jgi:hypothetical protein